MRKALLLAAALVLCSAPANAQQSAASLQAPAPAAQAQPAPAEKPAAPSFHLTREQIDERVRQAEAERGNRQVGSRNFWYTVAAVAVGVIIALLLIG